MSTSGPTISTHYGFFLIADISGYTHFVAHNDLEHAQGVLQDITNLVMSKLSAPLEFVELEGDAVFMFAPDVAVADSERLIDIVEVCYAAFMLRIEQMVRNSTCACSACRAVPSLGLKFVGHFGRYATQKTPRGLQLVGPDVTLVHLMLKTDVISATGVKAYAMLTESFIGRSYYVSREQSAPGGSADLGLIPYVTEIAPFGRMRLLVVNLADCVERHRQAFRDSLEHFPIDMEVVTAMDVPPSFLWGYITQPAERLRWQTDVRTVWSQAGHNGRTDVGWEGHCDHGGYAMTHRIMDWRPFDRITMFTSTTGWSPTKPPPCQVDFIFEESSSHPCQLRFVVHLRGCTIVQRLMFKMALPWIRKQWQGHFSRLRDISRNDWARIPEGIGMPPESS